MYHLPGIVLNNINSLHCHDNTKMLVSYPLGADEETETRGIMWLLPGDTVSKWKRQDLISGILTQASACFKPWG